MEIKNSVVSDPENDAWVVSETGEQLPEEFRDEPFEDHCGRTAFYDGNTIKSN